MATDNIKLISTASGVGLAMESMEHLQRSGVKLKVLQDKPFQDLDMTWLDYPWHKVVNIPPLKKFCPSKERPSSRASREALLAVLDYRYKLIEYNKRQLGITHKELEPAYKALVTFDLDSAVYLLYGYGLKAVVYLRLPKVEEQERHWRHVKKMKHHVSLQAYGNNGLLINQDVPYLPHDLPVHSGRVIKMPYGCYGYGLHVWIGKSKQLPVVPESGKRKSNIEHRVVNGSTIVIDYCSSDNIKVVTSKDEPEHFPYALRYYGLYQG